MKKNNKNKNNLISISPSAPPESSVPAKRSPEPPVPKEVPATSAYSFQSLPSPTVAEKVAEQYYPNSETSKAQILSENKNKSGIYMWTNKINEKCYIGSAVDLPKRLKFYYYNSSMQALIKNSKSHKCSAILKHGRSNFSLTILDYCSSEQCIEREDYYLCSLPHEYNILPKAGSRLGHKHSDETKLKISDAKKGQPKIEGTGIPSQQIEVFDNKNNTITSYDSMSEAARALNINKSVINLYFTRNQQKPYKGQYTFKK